MAEELANRYEQCFLPFATNYRPLTTDSLLSVVNRIKLKKQKDS